MALTRKKFQAIFITEILHKRNNYKMPQNQKFM